MVRSNLPDINLFLGKSIPGMDKYVLVEAVGSGNNAHVFRAHSEELQRNLACKIIPTSNLIGPNLSPPTWWQEIQKANRVDSLRVVKITEKHSMEEGGDEFVLLVSDYIAGISLRDWVKCNEVDLNFVEFYFAETLELFREMEEAGVTHGDLHLGNIIVKDQKTSFTGQPYRLLVTDFGVPRGQSASDLTDDYLAFSNNLRILLEHVNYQDLDSQDRQTFNLIQEEFIGKLLVEDNRSFENRARDPHAAYDFFQQRKQALRNAIRDQTSKLTSPFDYLSCEQMGPAHQILKSLYSNRFMGLQQVEARNNTVLTGPRGCGKSTVFRSLSLSHRIATDDDIPEDVTYIGTYYRCDDLYWNFPRYRLPENELAYDVPIHYITASLLQELLTSISDWSNRHFVKTFKKEEERVSRSIWSVLALEKPANPPSYSFRGIASVLNKQRKRASKKNKFAHDPKHKFGVYWGPEILLAVCEALNVGLEFLRNRPVYFLIDDYSSPKVSSELQENLNRLLMQRSQYCFFKFATESPKSYSSSDADGKSYVESREYTLVNLGIEFINADADERLLFIDDVFKRRLEAVENYPVRSLVELIGDDPAGTNYNEVARQIRDNKDPLVWGRRTFADLCSGDIHYLVGLASKMVTSTGGVASLVTQKDVPAISPETQNRAIREEAGTFLRNLRALPEGERLVEIVNAFGLVANSLLRNRSHDSSEASPPHQASRIEPYEDPKFDEATQKIYDDLLRYAVFIEDVRGKSRRGQVVPRLYLRRFLIPFFKLTFSKRDSLELSTTDLSALLLTPKEFGNKKRLSKTTSDAPQVQLTMAMPMPTDKQ